MPGRRWKRRDFAAHSVRNASPGALGRALDCGDQRKAARQRGNQRAAAGIVGVFAEDFEPSRDPPGMSA